MAVREMGQRSLVDALVYKRAGLNERLDKIAALIDWSPVERLLAPLQPRRRGAPGYPALLLFKAVLLAQWNSLSDEAMEEMLADRMSFQRFCGLGLSQPAPDHSTLWRFREALVEEKLGDRLFEEINRQLDGHGLFLRQGTLIDATLVAAQAAPPKPPKQAAPPDPTFLAPGEQSANERPASERPASKLVKSTVDPDAGWTRRGKSLVFGYKGHIGVDRGSGLIRAQTFTSAEVNETEVADSLVMGDEKAVYADKAYDTHARKHDLKRRGIKYRIQQRPNKHHALTDRQTQRNVLIGRVRGRVETVFAYLKRICRYRRVSYFGKARNALQFALLCTAYNLFKATRPA